MRLEGRSGDKSRRISMLPGFTKQGHEFTFALPHFESWAEICAKPLGSSHPVRLLHPLELRDAHLNFSQRFSRSDLTFRWMFGSVGLWLLYVAKNNAVAKCSCSPSVESGRPVVHNVKLGTFVVKACKIQIVV